MLNQTDLSLVINTICHAADMIKDSWQEAAWERSRPSVIYSPKVFIDDNQWCALYGEDIQNGVAGFGKSPADAMYDFDSNWRGNLADLKSNTKVKEV